MSVVLLSGGTGGAKLARGLYDVLGEQLTVIANTGDDIEFYGAHVSPDPDMISYWLAGRISERGWGIDGDSFGAIAMLRELGHDVWFNLGDRDLALCLERRRLLDAGLTLSEAHAELTRRLGVRAAVVPMSDDPVRTVVVSDGRRLSSQEFLIARRGAAPIDEIVFDGAATAGGAPGALAAIAAADAILIGPSNPIISIGPILAVAPLRAAIEAAAAPVIAVSPFVAGRVLKGPTAACLAWAGHRADAAGVAACYAPLIRAIIADEPVDGVRSHTRDVSMATATARRELAVYALEIADSMRR